MDATELASIVAKVLAAEGADVLFGIPGGGNNLEVIGAADAAGIRFVLGHTEMASAFMAGAYAELTGTPAGCVITRGPGAASGVNGVAQAWLDRQALLMLTDTVSAADAPRIAHQRLDQHALFSPITKWSGVLNGIEPAATMRHAIDVARAPAPGPVHLDFDPTVPTRHPLSGLAADSPGTRGDMTAAKAALARARRPVVLVGMGARSCAAAVRGLVRDTNIPVLQTYKAKGIVPDSWPNAAGVLTGAAIEAPVIEAADVIVAIGLDTVELIPSRWPYSAPLVYLAPWADDSSYFTPAAQVIGPLDELLADLGELRDTWPRGFARAERTRGINNLLAGPLAAGLGPAALVRTIRAAAPPGSMATVDSGAHMLPAMALWDTDEPGTVLISSGLATMGYGLPAAIAAALAHPDRRTFCLVGDGGLGMVMAELETVARLRLPITIVVFNDSTLSLIKVKQRRSGHGGSGAVAYRRTDFAAVAEAMGVTSWQVSTQTELDAALRQALTDDAPALIDASVDPSPYAHIIATIRGNP